MSKKRILLCWGYHRKGWLHAFNALNDDFDFHYIFHINKPPNELNYSKSSNLHYWSDFKSAQQLINKIKPNKIVFMGIEGANVIALNIIAKLKGVETIVLQHGMFHTYEDYLNLAIQERNQRKLSGTKLESVGTNFLLKFYLRSLWWHLPALFHIWKLRKNKLKYPEVEALKNSKSSLRQADKYAVFTIHNASIFQVRDGVNVDKMIEIGNPEMDEVFKAPIKQNDDKFYLLVDQPWSEVKEFNSPGFGVTIEQTLEFHQKLGTYAKKNATRLYIKLHPYSYESNFFRDDQNIIYLRDYDISGLLKSAQGVFGFSSTILLSAIYFNKCCLFKIWDQAQFQDEMHQLGVAHVLSYQNFTEKDVEFKGVEDGDKAEFVTRYLYKPDGKAIQRIKEVLN